MQQPASAAGVVANCDEASLRAAMAGGGAVTFACDGTITLTTTIFITNNTVLDGTGRLITLSGGGAVRALYVQPNVNFTLSHLTIANGAATNSESGAGLYNMGNTSIINCTFSNNALFAASFPPPGFGGAIRHDGGTLTVNGSTFVNNRCESSHSAIGVNSLFGSSTGFTITNCTFSGNSNGYATGAALGGFRPISTPYWIVNCTLVSNINGGIAFGSDNSSDKTATVVNTIVAHSIGGSNFYGNGFNKLVDGGHNISSDASAVLTNSTSLKNTDPLVGPLTDNGGPTRTIGLLYGSPATDAASDAVGPRTDQRGVARPTLAHSDIGAFEGGVSPGQASAVHFTSTNFTAGENQGAALVQIERTGTSAGTIGVTVSACAGTATADSDFAPTNIALVFAEGEMQKSVSIILFDDPAAETNEAVILSLSNPVGTVPDSPSTAQLTIFDDGVAYVLTNYSDAGLRAAVSQGGWIQFPSNGTITLTSPIPVSLFTVLDASDHDVVLSGGNAPQSPNYLFVPTNRSVTVGPDQLGVNFNAYRWNALSLDGVTSNLMQLRYAGTNGPTVRLLASSNLFHWVALSNNTVGSSNLLEFQVPVALETPRQFYRTVQD
jgi:hypothetical protein